MRINCPEDKLSQDKLFFHFSNLTVATLLSCATTTRVGIERMSFCVSKVRFVRLSLVGLEDKLSQDKLSQNKLSQDKLSQDKLSRDKLSQDKLS